jgi:hypothetical protein
MKYNVGDIIRLKNRQEYPEKYRGRIGIILEVEPILKTYKILFCGIPEHATLGIWIIEPIIAETIYKAKPPPP